MGLSFFPLLLLLLAVGCDGSSDGSSNHTKCRDGLILPRWTPTTNLSKGDVVARGVVYFIALAYIFVGVSIIADRFMAAIEVITSKEKEVVIKKPNGETQTISVRVWNETVSNLTLMALGSSAPEILLSVIEVMGQNFEAGDLGPGTIVGSAAFNMFVIIAICVWAIPSNETRRIKHLRVFFVTMTWSVFAYIWLYLILTWSSYGVIEVWEGIVTFLFFPTTVLTAYIADRRLLIYKCLSKKYRMNRRGVIVGGEGGEVEMGPTPPKGHANGAGQQQQQQQQSNGLRVFEEEENEEVREFEEHRREYIQLLRELRRKNPDKSMEELELMAREEILERGPKSRAFYRLQATKKLTGGGNLIRKRVDRPDGPEKEESKEVVREDSTSSCRIFFDPAHYTVMESVGQFAVSIVRSGDVSRSVCVDFETEDGTAEAGSDYEPLSGTVVFRPGETRQQVFVTVIDDDIFEEDEHFYVRLSNPRYLNPIPDAVPDGGGGAGSVPLELATPAIATVMILDDDHSGVFGFQEAAQEVSESTGEYHLRVARCSGARGRVILPFRTLEGTAKPGVDYKHVEGVLVFENNENG